ncbi:MAG TPA: energy-coupling factor transporter transmembrane component T [Halanaerobiales bacterium]|nr:energy-coupling factor transporter transmembrane component T [Halanaerobiales bacterium]
MKIDPRTKLVMVFSLSTLAVFVVDILLLSIVLIISIIVSNFFKEDWGFLNRACKFIVLLVGIAFLQSIFSPSGEILFAIKDFTLLTTGGLAKGIRVILRMLVIIISATIMKGSSPREIIQGLIQWKVPYEIAFMVSLAIRFIPILGQEAKDAFTAIQLRGIEIDKLSLTKRFKVYSYMFMPVLSGVIHRAKELSTSLEARAFRAYPERTSYIKLELSKNDLLIMSASIVFTITMLVIYILLR